VVRVAGPLEADHLRDPLQEPRVGALTLWRGGAQLGGECERGLEVRSAQVRHGDLENTPKFVSTQSASRQILLIRAPRIERSLPERTHTA